ncbi:hypothetical protein Tco_0163887 [Tanacetum coccineum]
MFADLQHAFSHNAIQKKQFCLLIEIEFGKQENCGLPRLKLLLHSCSLAGSTSAMKVSNWGGHLHFREVGDCHLKLKRNSVDKGREEVQLHLSKYRWTTPTSGSSRMMSTPLSTTSHFDFKDPPVKGVFNRMAETRYQEAQLIMVKMKEGLNPLDRIASILRHGELITIFGAVVRLTLGELSALWLLGSVQREWIRGITIRGRGSDVQRFNGLWLSDLLLKRHVIRFMLSVTRVSESHDFKYSKNAGLAKNATQRTDGLRRLVVFLASFPLPSVLSALNTQLTCFISIPENTNVQAVEVQKGEEQVTLLESIKHCFVSLDAPAAIHQASGSGSGAGPEMSAPPAGENVVAEENVILVGTYVDLVDPEDNLTVVEKGDAAQKQPEKAKRKKLSKQSDPLPAKRLRIDHPSLASGTGGKTLASLRRTIPEGSLLLGSSPADVHTQVTVRSSRTADAPVYTAADTVTSSRGKTLVVPTSDVGGSSQPETSEESADSFYETAVLNSEDAKRWYVPRWNITNDSLLDDGFSCRTLVDRVAPPGFFSTLRNMDYDQLFEEFNVGAARQICLGSEVRSRTEHELELKEKLRAKYDARGVLLSEKDAEIARLKSLVREKETESAEVLHLRDQVSVLAADKSLLSAEVSALKNAVSQKDTDISLLDSRASYLKSALDDSQAACGEARNLISSLSSERDGLASEVSTLHSAFRDFKEKMEAQQEAQAQELYNRVAELEAHVMDVSGRLEGEFYPAYLTALAGRRWLLTHGMELAMVKCLKSPEYQGILGHALGRAVDYGMQEGLAAGHEHGIAGTPLSAVVAYNPETAENNYLDAVRALEEVDFPLVHLLKSKKDSGMDEVLDCFLLDGPLANLPEAAHLQPCLEQLSVPIYHADVNVVARETSLSFALLNFHTRAEGAKKHAAALRQLMADIVSHPLSSQNLLGEASTSVVLSCVEDLDTDEDLGSVVCMPHLEDPRFETLP